MIVRCIQGSLEEYGGMVRDGLIYAACFADGHIWARKTMMPQDIPSIIEVKAGPQLPAHIQQLCDAEADWDYGTDRTWYNHGKTKS